MGLGWRQRSDGSDRRARPGIARPAVRAKLTSSGLHSLPRDACPGEPGDAVDLSRPLRPDVQKKSAHAAEQNRPDILKRREDWFDAQLDLPPASGMPHQHGPPSWPRPHGVSAPPPPTAPGGRRPLPGLSPTRQGGPACSSGRQPPFSPCRPGARPPPPPPSPTPKLSSFRGAPRSRRRARTSLSPAPPPPPPPPPKTPPPTETPPPPKAPPPKGHRQPPQGSPRIFVSSNPPPAPLPPPSWDES